MVAHHLVKLKEEMEKFSKLKYIRMEDNRRNICVEDGRMEFKWQTNLVDTRKTMKGKYSPGETWCPHCQEGRVDRVEESPSHLLRCNAYVDLRVGVDPELNRKYRARYLRAVNNRRTELEKEIGEWA